MRFRDRLDQYRDSLIPHDTLIECVTNERIPEREGVVLRVHDVGVSFVRGSLVAVGGSDRLQVGDIYYCNLPTRARDLIHADALGIRYTLDEQGHRCAWKVVR